MKKILSIILIGVLAVMSVGLLACKTGNGYEPVKVEGETWTYYILKDGSIALMGLNEEAVPEDGVLYIPSKIDGKKVSQFGIWVGPGMFDRFTLPFMQKVTFADGLPYINLDFVSHGRITEFESKTGGGIYFSDFGMNIIVPDGCRESYKQSINDGKTYDFAANWNIVEKSESIGLEWLIDESGLLKGYFGLDGDNYVLPAGIKKIDAWSFKFDNPKTVILNEDLEEIGDESMNFNPNLEEIVIPKSVKYIGKDGVIAHKVYLYRSTQTHEQAFWHLCEVVYLD